MKVLVVDVGGTHVKLLVTGKTVKRMLDSGPRLTPGRMVTAVKTLVADWKYEAVSIGVPAPVVRGRITSEPANLGGGWKRFDFAAAFDRPVKLVNDAAMQALGSYRGGRMLFLGIGTGLGSALVIDGAVVPLELAHLPYRKGRTFEDYVGLRGLRRLGKKRWRHHVLTVVERLRNAILCEDLVLGGGNVRFLKKLPPGARLGGNSYAFKGGYALWSRPVEGEGAKGPPRR
ncbi:MAG TPA: ROK family protein [Polyangia bacterium]|nr:ROK family protein [Polyangia bacterium]